ncbi:MAG TPA: SDR family oxidoreductase, partial [Acidobacteriaceae bacterium]|nr:SDR family oxidoreductase [Acidobacteriaceae bacterium]
VLVNNAGVYEFAPIGDVSEQHFHRMFDTNVLGPILATREAAKYLGEGGSVINVGSVVSKSATPATVVYSATKGALDTVTRVLASELGPKKIRVNSINPGPVETEGTHAAGFIGSDFMKGLIERTPLGRIGKPDDFAPIAVFLASDESGWLTGETLVVSGGLQ